MKKKKNRKKQTLNKETPKLVKGSKKAFLMLALVLWSVLCVAMYYLSIKEGLLWMIHVYMGISLPCLCAAVLINAYCNARFASADESEKKPDESFIKKMRNVIKALIIIGFPPLACVLIEFIAVWLIEKF